MFHYDSELKINQEWLTTERTTDKVSSCDLSRRNDLEDILRYSSILQSGVDGIAVKLSLLKKKKLTIEEVLGTYKSTILIDAEFDRLDRWLDSMIEKGRIQKVDLDRIILTVQVKRKDAKEQIISLRKHKKDGLRILLVAGHPSYLHGLESVQDVAYQFQSLFDGEFVTLIGCGNNMVENLRENYSLDLSSDQILELRGYEKIKGSKVWSYFAGEELSPEAEKYLQRRNSRSSKKFLLQSIQDLLDLISSHTVYLFLDICCRSHYLDYLFYFNRINKK